MAFSAVDVLFPTTGDTRMLLSHCATVAAVKVRVASPVRALFFCARDLLQQTAGFGIAVGDYPAVKAL